jgi:hypothetical protein
MALTFYILLCKLGFRISSFICFAGTEALFADLCYFPVLAIQVPTSLNILSASVNL